MDIQFISDYVCPYCLVAKQALKAALAQTGLEAEITWLPFELTPEPKERVDTYHDEARRAHYQILKEPCVQLGLDMKLPPNVIPRPYTRLAFEGWYYACAKGRGDAYNDLVYEAYFIHEQDIGRIDVLASLAGQAGLDSADFIAALERGQYALAEKNAVNYTRNVLQIKQVPTIFINGQPVTLRNYTVEEMAGILRNEAEQSDAPAFSCSEDGCGVN